MKPLSDAEFWTAERLAQLERACAAQWPKKKFAILLKHFAANQKYERGMYWFGIPNSVAFWAGATISGELFLGALQANGHSADWALAQMMTMRETFVSFGLKAGNVSCGHRAVKRNFSSPAIFIRTYLNDDGTITAHLAGRYLTGMTKIVEGLRDHSKLVISSAASTHARTNIWVEREKAEETVQAGP